MSSWDLDSREWFKHGLFFKDLGSFEFMPEGDCISRQHYTSLRCLLEKWTDSKVWIWLLAWDVSWRNGLIAKFGFGCSIAWLTCFSPSSSPAPPSLLSLVTLVQFIPAATPASAFPPFCVPDRVGNQLVPTLKKPLQSQEFPNELRALEVEALRTSLWGFGKFSSSCPQLM